MSKADDLQARLESFADGVLAFCRTIVPSAEAGRAIDQLSGAATSVAANYRAARRARSHAEFTAKIGVVLEEADESEYWLGLAVRHRYGAQGDAKKLQQKRWNSRKSSRDPPPPRDPCIASNHEHWRSSDGRLGDGLKIWQLEIGDLLGDRVTLQ